HVPRLQLFMIEHADAAPAGFGVAIERKVHFFDAVTFGTRAELCLGARSGAVEKNEISLVHGLVLRALVFGWVFLRAFSSGSLSPPFSRAARSMILASISPASPPFAGRCDFQTSG